MAPGLGRCEWESEGGAVSAPTLAGDDSSAPWRAPGERWYAVQTRSRHEKRVVNEFRGRGIQSYLPLVREVHRWSDRRKVVEVPLFPGYAFVRMQRSLQDRLKVVQTHGVLSIVGSDAHGTPVPDEEIDAVRKILANEVRFVSCPFLKAGQRVRLRGGALDGIEGILVARKGETSVVISVEMIQRSLAISVHGYELQAA